MLKVVPNCKRSISMLVIGDCIVDHYSYGVAAKLSPEAPVPVVSVDREDTKLGGAANVALNCQALGARVTFLTLVGDDKWGAWVKDALVLQKVSTDGLLVSNTRKTTVKSRIVTNNQQIVRLDSEDSHALNSHELDLLINAFSVAVEHVDCIIISDYAKGVVSTEFVRHVIQVAKDKDKKVLVDPKGADFSKYMGATLLSPNRSETELALSCSLNSPDAIRDALVSMREKYQLDYALITLSEQGVICFDGELVQHVPTSSVDVYDVTGAGDTFIATLAYFLSQNIPMDSVLPIANAAATLAVSRLGNATVSFFDLYRYQSTLCEKNKILNVDEMYTLRQQIERPVVFTNGCFDLLHVGHVSYLKAARALGAFLIVAVNSDRSVKRIKGDTRPVNSMEDRMLMLAAFDFVDAVISFDADTPYDLIALLRPDILVKGADYSVDTIVGADLVNTTKIIPLIEGKSTTNLIKKMQMEQIVD